MVLPAARSVLVRTRSRWSTSPSRTGDFAGAADAFFAVALGVDVGRAQGLEHGLVGGDGGDGDAGVFEHHVEAVFLGRVEGFEGGGEVFDVQGVVGPVRGGLAECGQEAFGPQE